MSSPACLVCGRELAVRIVSCRVNYNLAEIRFTRPLPSLEKQRFLVNALFHGRKKAEELRKQSSINRTTAWANFEAAVYAERC